jgi:MFS family permease
MTVAGVGATVGPVFAGTLAEHVSLGAPFFVSAVLIFVLTAVLATAGPGGRTEHERLSLLGSLRAARLDRLLLAGLVITMLAGLADGVVGLLAPLQLDENGLSAGAIGAVFSASAAIFLVCSVLLVRAGDRAVTLGAAALGALALALTMTPLLVSISTGAVTAGVLLRTIASAVLYTISFPLATRGAYRVGLGRGTALGLANLCWGMSTLVGPIAAGALAETVGARVAYVGLAGAALGVAAWLFVARAREAESVAARAAPASAKMRP